MLFVQYFDNDSPYKLFSLGSDEEQYCTFIDIFYNVS